MPTTLNPITGQLDLVDNLQSATDRGATTDNIIGVPGVQFDVNATPATTAPGLLQWNATDETLDLGMPDSVVLQIGQENQIKVRNNTGSTILNGKPVYISGSLGNRPTIALAKGDAHATSIVAGVTTQDIPNNSDGKITTQGYVRDLNTLSFSEGDILWLSKTTAGDFVNAEPAVPHHSSQVAIVTRSHGTQGSILINPTHHSSLEDLSDVNGTPLTTTGQLPVWNQTGGYFDFDKNLITEYVPYTGATGDVDLGTHTLRTTGGLVAYDSMFWGEDATFKFGYAGLYGDEPVFKAETVSGFTVGFYSGRYYFIDATLGTESSIYTDSGYMNFLGNIAYFSDGAYTKFLNILDAGNIVLSSSTGTKIGTATNQKLAFYNSTPIIQPIATLDLGTVLSNLGLRAAGTAYSITTSGATSFTGTINLGGQVTVANGINFAINTSTGTKFGTANTQKIGFWNATPVVQPGAYTQTYSTATRTHANLTSADIGAFTGGSVGFLDAAERDNIRTQYNALKADLTNLKQIVNALIDDHQSIGLAS